MAHLPVGVVAVVVVLLEVVVADLARDILEAQDPLVDTVGMAIVRCWLVGVHRNLVVYYLPDHSYLVVELHSHHNSLEVEDRHCRFAEDHTD